MKHCKNTPLFILVVIIFLLASCNSKAQNVVLITGDKLLEIQRSNDRIQIIDVRTAQEVDQGYIPGAVQIDFFDKDFSEKIINLDSHQPIIVYCASGGRSAKASEILIKNGYQEVYDLQGGFRQWHAEGKPEVVEEPKR